MTYKTIILKNSADPGKTPTLEQLELGELAVNTHDAKLYIKKDNGTARIVEVGSVANEPFIVLPVPIGTVEYDCTSTRIFYNSYSGNSNWTANLTNLILEENFTTCVSIVINQGATGYYPANLHIDGPGGGPQTINWQGNQNPTPSTNRLDVVNFTILYTGGNYIVLGQMIGF